MNYGISEASHNQKYILITKKNKQYMNFELALYYNQIKLRFKAISLKDE